MTRSGARWFGLFTLALLAVEAAPAWANAPPPLLAPRPEPASQPQPPLPPPDFGDEQQPPVPKPDVLPNPLPTPAPKPPNPQPRPVDDFPPKRLEPKRTGPFRSCGSGAGLGLAGIAAAWGMLWLGNRFARVARRR